MRTLAAAIASMTMWARAAKSDAPGDRDAKRIYRARYENARGDTRETRNPGDRSARLDIRHACTPGGANGYTTCRET